MNATVKVPATKSAPYERLSPPEDDIVEALVEGIEQIASELESAPTEMEGEDVVQKPEVGSQKPEVGSQKPEEEISVVQGLSDGFVEVDSSKLIWSPKVAFARKDSVRGYLLEKVILGFDGGSAFYAYLVQLTKDCPCVDRHGKVVQAKVSQEVFVKEHYEFQPWDSWTNNADQVVQVEAIPLGLRNYEDGHESWMFKWGVGLAASRLTVSPKSMARFSKKS